MKEKIWIIFLTATLFYALPCAAADLDGNGRIDRADVQVMKDAFFTSDPRADLDGNGIVNFGDLALLRAAVGSGNRATDGVSPLGTGLPSITLLPVNQDADLLQFVELELWMDFSAEPTIGGGLDIEYDPGALGFVDFVFDAAFPDEPEFRNLPDTSDPGVLGSLSFGHFDGLSGPLLVGLLTFRAVDVGITELTMSDDSDGPAGPFVSLITLAAQQVDFFGAQIDISDAPRGVIEVEPTSITFPDTLLGQQSFADLTVSNTGDADLGLGLVAVENPLTAPFSIQTDGCSAQVLAPAGSCEISLVFSANAIGEASNSFDIPSEDFFNPSVTVTVSGTGVPVPAPKIAIQPSVVDFGELVRGNTAEADITVSNLGTADLLVSGVAGNDPLDAPFFVLADTCSGQPIAPGDNCLLTLQFAPVNLGIFGDSFDIASNDPDQPQIIATVLGSAADQVSALLIGLLPGAAQCDNLSTGQSIPVPLAGARTFKCEDAGLSVSTGDQIRIVTRGVARNPDFVGGATRGVNLLQILCRNQTTGMHVSFQPMLSNAWNCIGHEVTFGPLDSTRMVVWGIAE